MNEVRQKIICEAVRLFSDKGYLGTSMRDIMKAAGCTQPTLYYYFDNKRALFQESVLGEFRRLMEHLLGNVDQSMPPKDIYVCAAVKRKHFTEYQRQVYRLAIQGWYHLLGDEEVENELCGWVRETMDRRKAYLSNYTQDEVQLETFTALLMHVYLNLTEQIVLMNADIPDEEIDRRFTLLFKLIS